jgi:hypothetical protein
MPQPCQEVKARHAKNAGFGDFNVCAVGENNVGNECNNVGQIFATGVHVITCTRIQGNMVFVGDYG